MLELGEDLLDRIEIGTVGRQADFGPTTAESLHLKQRSLWRGRSDGIFTPKLAEALGWEVLGPLDAPVA